MRNGMIAMVAAVAIAALTAAAPAVTVTWDKTKTGAKNYGDGINWVGGSVPSPGDDVVIEINSDLTLDLQTDRTVNSIDLKFDKKITVDSASETLTVTSGVVSATKAGWNRTLDFNADLDLGAPGLLSTATNRGTFNVNGAIDAGANSITIQEGKIKFNAANTYSGGTIVEDDGLLYANAAGSLGTGDVTVDEGGFLFLDSLAYIPAGKKVAAHGVVVLPSANPGTAGDDVLTADSSGTVGVTVDCTVTDMMTLGNGEMSLGAGDGEEVDLTSASLAPGANDVWRLGGADGTLTIINEDTLTGPNHLVIAGQTGSVFQADPIVEIEKPQNYTGVTAVLEGKLSLTGDAVLAGSGTTEVMISEGGAIESHGADPSIARLGTVDVVLDGGVLTHYTSGGDKDQTVGALVVAGGSSELNFDGKGGGQSGKLTMAELKRDATLRGTLSMEDTTGSKKYFAATAPALTGAGGGAGTKTRSILPCAIMSGSNMVTYDAVAGFIPLSDGAGEYETDVNSATSGENVKMTGLNGDLNITGDRTMNALWLDTDGTKSADVKSDSATVRTLTIESGFFRSEKLDVEDTVTLAFGSAEAIIEVGGSRHTTIYGALTGTGGLTKRGGGGLELRNGAANTLTGQYTVNDGSLTTSRYEQNSIPDSVVVRVAEGASYSVVFASDETIAGIAGNGTFSASGGRDDGYLWIGATEAAPFGGVFVTGGSVAPGDYLPGAMTINTGKDDAHKMEMRHGDLLIDITHQDAYDSLDIFGDLYLFDAMALDISLDGFVPNPGDVFDIINVHSQIFNEDDPGILFGQVTQDGQPTQDWIVEMGAEDTIRLLYEPQGPPPTVIPEPATMLLVVAGAGALGGYVRRRRRA
jgi:hypothetical protein